MADIQGFSQASNAHGFKKAAWLSLGFVGVILTVFHTFSILMLYLDHPLVTKYSLVPQDDMPFPFVAVSTTRIVNCEKLEYRLQNRSILPEKSFRPHCWLYHSSKCKMNRLDLLQKCNATVGGKMVAWSDNSEPNVQRSLNVMKTSWKEEILHRPLDFVVECKWNGEIIPLTHTSCEKFSFCVQYYQGSWQLFVNYVEKLMSSKMGGDDDGLEITLKVPQTNPAGFGVIDDMDGFIIEFVPPKYISGAKRIVVPPGGLVSMGLREVQHKKLPAPFESNCIDSWNETFFGEVTKNILQDIDRNFINYHQESCHAICRINRLVDKCNCTWTKIDPKDFANIFHAPKCEEYDSDQLSCLTINDLTMKSSRELCNCQEACDMIQYEVTVSSSKWPSMELWPNVGREFGVLPTNHSKPNFPMTQMMTKEDTVGQLARIKIFFESNQRTVIQQNPKFESFLVFFNTWGGALSIYLGISVMTFIGQMLSFCDIMINFGLKLCRL